jgi:hypothetical protein
MDFLSVLSPSLPISGLLPLFLLPLYLVRFGCATSCPAGIEWSWEQNSWFTQDRAYFNSDHYTGQHNPFFRGSFIPSVGGSHGFKHEAQTYGSFDFGTPSVEFTFDGTLHGPGSRSVSIQVDLNRDFRYSLFGTLNKGFYYVYVWLYVSWPGTAEHILNSTHAQICQTSGCENLDFNRTYDCKPSPSQSPSPTVSHSPSPTRTRSQSPSCTRSPTATPSRGFAPSQRLLASGKALGPTKEMPSSDAFNATHCFSQSESFTGNWSPFHHGGLVAQGLWFMWIVWLTPAV